MHYNQSWAAKGNNYEGRSLSGRSMQRAAVNISKTENSYEMLVFAPWSHERTFSSGREWK